MIPLSASNNFLIDNFKYIITIMPSFIEGLKITLLVFIVTIIISIPLGLIIALARLSKIKVISMATEFYIWILRGTPLLLQIFFIFFCLPLMNVTLDRLPSVFLAFGLNYAAYFGEIFRSGIQSIAKGQHEAATILGFTPFQINTKIIFPQVFKRTLPAVGNEIITLIKDTSLVYVVGLSEVIKYAKIASNRDVSIIPFFVAAVIYLILTAIITKVFKDIEKKVHYEE